MRPSHLNSYDVRIMDAKGDTIDSLGVDAPNLRIALERTCRLIATRDSGHGQKATEITVKLGSVGPLNVPKPEREEMDTL